MGLPLEYKLLIASIIIPLIIDCIRLFNYGKIKKHSLVLIVKIFFVIFEFISIRFGLNLINCISEINDKICSSSELNTLIFGIGIAFIVIGTIGYVFTLVTLNLKDLMKG